MTDEVLYVAPVLGYRAWKAAPLHGLAPISGVSEAPWREGVNVAYCHNQWGHSAPAPFCHCGFNAYHCLDDVEVPIKGIAGAVAMRGRVQVHAKGVRCEEAQVIGLLRSEALDDDYAEGIAARYGVPLFDRPEQLIAYAERYARPAPRELRPAGGAEADHGSAVLSLLHPANDVARDARKRLARWGVGEEAIEHFRIGVSVAERKIVAPLAVGDIGKRGGVISTFSAPVYTSAHCAVCGTETTVLEVAKRSREFTAAVGKGELPATDPLACAACGADAERAAIGWLKRVPSSGAYRWSGSAAREAITLRPYHFCEAERELELDAGAPLVVAADVVTAWIAWAAGLRAVVSRFPGPTGQQVEQVRAAVALAEDAGRELIYVPIANGAGLGRGDRQILSRGGVDSLVLERANQLVRSTCMDRFSAAAWCEANGSEGFAELLGS